jgi:hypothetical protein
MRKLCECGAAQAVRAGGLCNKCFTKKATMKPAKQSGELVEAPIESIRTEGLQMRAAMSEDAIEEYAAAYRVDPEALPPGQAVKDAEGLYWVWDGLHRFEGLKRAGLETMHLVVTEGAKEEALWLATSANRTHGIRRSNEDKRRAVEMALRLNRDLKKDLSDNAVAEHCGVSQPFVGAVRAKLGASYNGYKMEARTVERGGKTYTQNTANIGKGRKAAPANEEEAISAERSQNAINNGQPPTTTALPAGPPPDNDDDEDDATSEAPLSLRPTPPPAEDVIPLDSIAPTGPPPVDAVGVPLGEDAIALFTVNDDFDVAKKLCQQLTEVLDRIARHPGGADMKGYLRLTVTGKKARYESLHVRNIARELKFQRLHCCVCPYCHDKHPGKVMETCRACNGLGVVSLSCWNRTPDEMRKAVEVAFVPKEGDAA